MYRKPQEGDILLVKKDGCFPYIILEVEQQNGVLVAVHKKSNRSCLLDLLDLSRLEIMREWSE